jgi:hypothetical protein
MPDAEGTSRQQDQLGEPEDPTAVSRRVTMTRRLVPGRLQGVVAPIPKAAGYYARSWRTFLAPHPDDEIPVVRPTLALAGQALYDEVLVAGIRTLRQQSDVHGFERIEREALSVVDFATSAGWLDEPGSYFELPPPLTDVTLRSAKSRRAGAYTRVSFDSGYEPRVGEPGRDRWLSYAPNRRVCAWMMRHDEPRPWLVCVHGAIMGRPAIDLALFRARWMHEQLGLNVAFPVLPLHGARRRDLPRSAVFPGEDVLDNLHGAAQSVWDIRRLLSWIRAQDGNSPIGITGVSLGGYVTSLVASIEDNLACAIVGVPVVDLTDLIQQHAGTVPQEQVQRIVRPAKLVGRVISPLALEPRVPYEGRFIYAGLADRLVLPREQVKRLWVHWGRPNIHWYEGGHAGFRRSKPVQTFLLNALVQSGLVDSSQARLSKR